MSWSSKTKPTPANIRHRVSAAQEAIDGALDPIKKRAIEQHLSDAAMRKLLVPLDNAHAWLVDAQRRFTK